ncbi:MAG TPA: hypothetical protein VNI52_00015 [Sphingobacteriaceae bacterium]|nr:hypothetical protein [Sphingobacteriaceae bacterium]
MNILKSLVKSIYLPLKRQYSISRLKRAAGKPNLKIVVGSSDIYQKGWIPTEIDFLNMLKISDWENFFKQNSVDSIIAEHVWEHLTPEQGLLAATNCFKYLKSAGHLRIAVPDGFNPKQEYLSYVKPGGSGAGADDHKLLYNYQSMTEMLQRAGFNVKLLEFFDEHGKFNNVPWDKKDGMVWRSKEHDPRNQNGELNYTSLIVDAIKP